MEATELIASLGERLGIELEFDADGLCSFGADGMTITIHHLHEIGVLVLIGDLGEPPPERLENLYKSMLEANYLFSGTGGATLSCDPETGHFSLCRAMYCRGIDADSFFSQTESFVSVLEAWLKLVANFRDAVPEENPGYAPERSNLFGLRV